MADDDGEPPKPTLETQAPVSPVGEDAATNGEGSTAPDEAAAASTAAHPPPEHQDSMDDVHLTPVDAPKKQNVKDAVGGSGGMPAPPPIQPSTADGVSEKLAVEPGQSLLHADEPAPQDRSAAPSLGDDGLGAGPVVKGRKRNKLKVPAGGGKGHSNPRKTRQKVTTAESALFNPDVVFLLAALLDARDLRQASLSCKALGAKQAVGSNGLSLVEEAARRLFECASDWERSCLTKHDGEGWVELYHHLLTLRSKLTFDQLVGDCIQYCADQSTVFCSSDYRTRSSALCSDHRMRSGRHFAVFTTTGTTWSIGVVRPVQIDRSDFGDGGLDYFNPGMDIFWDHLIGKRTDRWGDSNVHCCFVNDIGGFSWYDWTRRHPFSRVDGFQRGVPIGLLLDLDEGTLSIYQRGQRLATLNTDSPGSTAGMHQFFMTLLF